MYRKQESGRRKNATFLRNEIKIVRCANPLSAVRTLLRELSAKKKKKGSHVRWEFAQEAEYYSDKQ